MFASIGSVIIDDIVLPTGETRMGALGGGATHAAMGMRAWTRDVRIIAALGKNFPEGLYEQLGEAFDLGGLVRKEGLPTPRAWQLFEADGHRSEVFRTGYEEFLALNIAPDDLPLERLALRGVHLQPEAPGPLREWIARLRQAGCKLLLWEPWDLFCTVENYGGFREILPLVDGVSPNLDEARALTGLTAPLAIVERMLEDGAALVALRMGAEGSLVGRRGEPVLTIPAVPVDRVVDATGAGNAYCGGLVVGLAETGSLEEAVRRAAVSASLALEQFGAMIPLDGLSERARRRLKKAGGDLGKAL